MAAILPPDMIGFSTYQLKQHNDITRRCFDRKEKASNTARNDGIEVNQQRHFGNSSSDVGITHADFRQACDKDDNMLSEADIDVRRAAGNYDVTWHAGLHVRTSGVILKEIPGAMSAL